MTQLSASEVKQMFLDFFKEKGHQVEPSASLIPVDDPSLLWINSGVATLKKYFDGTIIPDNPRIVNAQKSIRTNDIENVGYTARHHTFFEMLGNFSIGDYFKKEAIEWAWEFLTSDKWLGLDPERLSVTVHPEDDEAYNIWLHEIKVPEERIIRIEENFWDIGEGPSGPNTEIFYDRGETYGNDPNDLELFPGGENERYLEVWNLVFSEFNHNPDHTYTPLPNKNIDTGMGLERLMSILQDTPTNFETELFMPIIKQIEAFTSYRYGEHEEVDTAFKVIADHIRTLAFAIGDGALPSNEGRGYVLRRLLRRAVRFATQLEIKEPFMYKLVSTVGTIMKDFYPEVLEKANHIEKIIMSEEERFHETLNEGLHILENVMESVKQSGSDIILGQDVFKLYDTYGFPKELTEEYVAEHGFKIDDAGFQEEMEKQVERARKARQHVDSMQIQDELFRNIDIESTFVGYDQTEVSTTIEAIIQQQEFVTSAQAGDTVHVILKETPFYAESGGQVSDHGWLYAEQTSAYVEDVKKTPKGQHVHEVTIKDGELKVGQQVTAQLEQEFRIGIIKNHTATHLLHQTLKDVLGDHVNQAGSLVTPERLRFDFTHFNALTDDELKQIEQIVNEHIWASLPVQIDHMKLDEAKQLGAMALFGEKYGDIVRVVQIGDYSIELCGGCHVQNSSEIGLFKIVSESGIGAGTRRIEALTSQKAYEFMSEKLNVLDQAAKLLKTNEDQLVNRIHGLFDDMKVLEKTNESLSAKLAHLESSSLTDQVKKIGHVNVLAHRAEAKDMNSLRNMVDDLKQKIDSAVILLAAENEGKVQLVAGVSKELIEEGLHAGHLIKEAAQICGGGGGGRPDMAQAGGRDPQQIQSALEFVYQYVEEKLQE